jgi:hypothetical protein
MNMRARSMISALVLSMSMVMTARAWADEPEPQPARFGERNQLVITADRLVPIFGYTTQAITVNEGDTTTTITDSGASMAFLVGHEPSLGTMHTVPRLAVDFTPLPSFTIGTAFVLAFGLDGTHTEERIPKDQPATIRENERPGATLFGFAPRVGYVLPIGKNLAFWPRAGLAFYSAKTQREQTSNSGVTSTATETDSIFSLDLDPQLVWTPLPHLLVHAGTLTNIPLTGSHETSFAQAGEHKDRSDDLSLIHIGISAGFGIWFDLARH